MEEEVALILDMAKEGMEGAYTHLENELTKIRAGKASPSLLNGLQVEYYGSMVPLSQVANINSMDARTLSIQPWEKSVIENIERSIINSNLGLAPQNNGESIMINIPPLTEERRRDLVKQAKSEGENAKVGIRSARKEANDAIKKMQKDGLSEDLAKDNEDQIQDITNDYVAKIDRLVEAKEKDIMKV